MITYNKLVRDKIPEIIAESGKKAETKILSNEEFLLELQKKAKEELSEYLNAKTEQESVEELADLLEIIRSLAVLHGASFDDLEEVRRKKAADRGGFEKKIFLIGVENEED